MKKLTGITLSILLTAALLVSPGCAKTERTVVVYTSVDQVFSERIFARFETKTGIKVRPVYDVEASKTVGLANRLIEEKGNPLADVFWNGEILRTLYLKANGVLAKADIAAAAELPETFVDPDGQWYAFGGRARVVLFNKKLIGADELPKTIAGLPTHPRVREAGIANPVFGTSSTHAAALYSEWGGEAAKAFYRSLKDSGISVLEGNGSVKDYVGRGRLAFGLVDTDDAFEAMADDPDLEIALLDQGGGGLGTLVIPNSAALINGAPHKPEAEAFMEYILSAEAEQECVNMDWIHIPVHGGVTPPEKFGSGDITVMRVNWTDLAEKLAVSADDMMNIFVD